MQCLQCLEQLQFLKDTFLINVTSINRTYPRPLIHSLYPYTFPLLFTHSLIPIPLYPFSYTHFLYPFCYFFLSRLLFPSIVETILYYMASLGIHVYMYTLLIKCHVPLMHSSTLNIYPVGNTAQYIGTKDKCPQSRGDYTSGCLSLDSTVFSQ